MKSLVRGVFGDVQIRSDMFKFDQFRFCKLLTINTIRSKSLKFDVQFGSESIVLDLPQGGTHREPIEN
jgi:hypothetical protein